MSEEELEKITPAKCPLCQAALKEKLCPNCGELVTLAVRVPKLFIDFLRAYYKEFCGYVGPVERPHADKLTFESAIIVRDIIDDHVGDRYAIVKRHGLTKIFEKADPTWLKFVEKEVMNVEIEEEMLATKLRKVEIEIPDQIVEFLKHFGRDVEGWCVYAVVDKFGADLDASYGEVVSFIDWKELMKKFRLEELYREDYSSWFKDP